MSPEQKPCVSCNALVVDFGKPPYKDHKRTCVLVKQWNRLAHEKVLEWEKLVCDLEDLFADCPTCGFGLPGPHDKNCKFNAALSWFQKAYVKIV